LLGSDPLEARFGNQTPRKFGTPRGWTKPGAKRGPPLGGGENPRQKRGGSPRLELIPNKKGPGRRKNPQFGPPGKPGKPPFPGGFQQPKLPPVWGPPKKKSTPQKNYQQGGGGIVCGGARGKNHLFRPGYWGGTHITARKRRCVSAARLIIKRGPSRGARLKRAAAETHGGQPQ